MFIIGNFLSATAQILKIVLELYMWIMIIRALLSWVNPDPYNPIVQAKIDTFINRNLDAFQHYQLSEAILRLKQGIGRLIRKKNDTGICIITDPRILKRNYGRLILDSLPVDAMHYKFPSTIIDQSKIFLGI